MNPTYKIREYLGNVGGKLLYGKLESIETYTNTNVEGILLISTYTNTNVEGILLFIIMNHRYTILGWRSPVDQPTSIQTSDDKTLIR